MNIKHQGVLLSEHGIIEKRGIFFHNPSAFAIQNLFYALFGAEYLCTKPYRVNRKGLNAFLMFYIKDGLLNFTYRGSSFTAQRGDIVLLDCNNRHSYHAEEPVRFCWFHFHGSASSAYCELLYKNHGPVFRDRSEAEPIFSDILNLLPKGSDADGDISVSIHRILSFLDTSSHSENNISPQIAKAQKYMTEHFSENISINSVAEHAALTRYHFSRRFRSETGMTPHEYLLNLRIAYAKEQLANSDASIEQIAFDCAFCSSSNFIRAFKAQTGMTPHKFRSMTGAQTLT